MLLYKKKKLEQNNKATDWLARKTANAIIAVQVKFTKKMNKLFINTPVRELKTILVLFCIVCGGYSMYIVYSSFIGNKSEALQVTPVKSPKHFYRGGDEIINGQVMVDEKTYQQIAGFKYYMDSLQQNQRKRYDSILQARPGLMDSVQMLEQIYFSPKQK